MTKPALHAPPNPPLLSKQARPSWLSRVAWWQKPAYGQHLWYLVWRKLRRDRVGMVALAVVLFYLTLALGVWLGLWGQHWEELLDAQGYSPVSRRFWFGTNFNGQDIFARAVYSTSTAFQVGIAVAVAAICLGGTLGCIAGYYSGRWVDELIIWFYGCFDSIPFYLFVAAVAFTLQDSHWSLYIAMLATMWTSTCKVVRGQVMLLKRLQFVESARALGASELGIMMRHLLPNTMPLLFVELSLSFVTAVKTEAVLSFLGLGIKDGVSWGIMLSEASTEVAAGRLNNFLAASGLLFGLVMAFNQFADALQDALDPRRMS